MTSIQKQNKTSTKWMFYFMFSQNDFIYIIEFIWSWRQSFSWQSTWSSSTRGILFKLFQKFQNILNLSLTEDYFELDYLLYFFSLLKNGMVDFSSIDVILVTSYNNILALPYITEVKFIYCCFFVVVSLKFYFVHLQYISVFQYNW